MNRNIQMKKNNYDGTFDNMYPITLDYNVFDENGISISERLNRVQNKLKGIKLSDVQPPYYIAHRAAKNVFPECSLEGYRGCMNLNIPFLEIDVQLSADGVLLVNHDSSMERTTDKTGQLKYITSMGFKTAKIDVLPGWTGTPVLFEDLIREFGNKAIYIVETKDRTTSEMLSDMLLRYNLEENCVVCSFNLNDLNYPMSLELPTMFLTNNTNTAPSTLVSKGITHVGISAAVTDLYFTNCIEAGLITHVYTINRRYEKDHYLNLGVHGIITDDPLWISEKSPILEWDSFRDQVFSHGMIATPAIEGYVGGSRGKFISPNKFGWDKEATTSDFVLQGWAGHLPNKFTIEMDINFVDSVSSVRWAGIPFCVQNDYWDDYSNTLSNGYQLLVRESGNIELFIRTSSGATLLGEMATTAIAEGSKVPIKIQVTDTQIIVTRVDTTKTMTITNNLMRNGYLFLGRRYTGVTYENMHVLRN